MSEKEKLLNAEIAKEYLLYDCELGLFYWSNQTIEQPKDGPRTGKWNADSTPEASARTPKSEGGQYQTAQKDESA